MLGLVLSVPPPTAMSADHHDDRMHHSDISLFSWLRLDISSFAAESIGFGTSSWIQVHSKLPGRGPGGGGPGLDSGSESAYQQAGLTRSLTRTQSCSRTLRICDSETFSHGIVQVKPGNFNTVWLSHGVFKSQSSLSSNFKFWRNFKYW